MALPTTQLPPTPAADSLLVTCEHGGNQVPPRYNRLFHGLQAALQTHRGYDFGALQMAQELAAALRAPLVTATVTRLLVDLNRSIGHAHLHAPAVAAATPEERSRILADHYQPYRAEVEGLVAKAVGIGTRVVHISSHSFTPELDGKVRTADVGLLYDPARSGEVALASRWQATLQQAAPHLRVRRNYPYAGKSDGFMLHLRRRYPAASYVGIELEVNQAIVEQPHGQWDALRATLIESLQAALAHHQGNP